MNCLKISKGKPEYVAQIEERTDNPMAKRKRTNNDLQNSTQKTKNIYTYKIDFCTDIISKYFSFDC